MPGIIFFTLSLYDPFDLCPFKIHKLGDLKLKNVDYFFSPCGDFFIFKTLELGRMTILQICEPFQFGNISSS